MAAGVARSTILTATHHVQLNKLRCGGASVCVCVCVGECEEHVVATDCGLVVVAVHALLDGTQCFACQVDRPCGAPVLTVSPMYTHPPTTPTCRQHFHKDVRKQLYSEDDDRNFFNRIKDALKSTEARLEEGRVALQHLEMFLLNVACDDPGAAIGAQLVLPMLQDRLDGAALTFKAERAKMAEDEIIAMEVRVRLGDGAS